MIELIVAAEAPFGIEPTTPEGDGPRRVGDLAAAIARKTPR